MSILAVLDMAKSALVYDFHCECGEPQHVDGYNKSRWRCASCGAVYQISDRLLVCRLDKGCEDTDPGRVYGVGEQV